MEPLATALQRFPPNPGGSTFLPILGRVPHFSLDLQLVHWREVLTLVHQRLAQTQLPLCSAARLRRSVVLQVSSTILPFLVYCHCLRSLFYYVFLLLYVLDQTSTPLGFSFGGNGIKPAQNPTPAAGDKPALFSMGAGQTTPSNRVFKKAVRRKR